jgi:hypothetical protein
MALKPLMPVLTAPPTPPRRSPGPYKRRAPSPSFTAPLPAPISLSPRLSSPLSAAASPFCTIVAQPPQRRPSSGETRAEFPSLPSPFCAPAGELWHTGAAGGQAPVSAPPCPLSTPPWVHGAPPDRPRSTVRGPGAQD